MEEFTICFPLNSNYSDHISKWVEFAARKQVKKLKLDLGVKLPVHDNESSYEGFLASQGSTTSSTRLYWLTDLYLRGVDVDDEAMECLISNSPFIERLHVIDSQKLHKLEAADPASNLKYLELRHCENLRHLVISAPNLDIIKLFMSHRLTVVNISAPILSRISLGAYCYENFR
ncbi:hypothetical protein FNV43_RR20685 [Rhamnella rubrinervis]|uniref:At1g61320/AtMIF1 LRR domain-containing protein n=1 Tax=Rhamnella rubrinervis TaxID=2594499 RepID=A0A8K0E1M2_9ROSA|nr:hypothetical protein FNV43_RR20685 [Rhamnella rubrinervis]